MLGKLALRNVRRSMKDYFLYILTITIIFSLLYAFNMIVYSDDIMMLSDLMRSMFYAVITVSIIIVFVTGWLVHYMNKFMLQRRSKEFGTYMMLGISNKAISKLFLMENVIMGAISLVIGILAGSFLYQVFTLIIMHIFEANYEVRLSFSFPALGLTVVYVILTYSFSLLRTKRKLKKMKVYDLLYAEKQNETMKLKNSKGNWLVFIASILFGILATFRLQEIFSSDELTIGKLGIVFLYYVICVYGFYLSLSSILIKIFIQNKRMKYSKDHLFLIRGISAKMNTMSMTLGTLGLLLTITLTSLSTGILFKSFFEEQVKLECPFDIAIYSGSSEETFQESKEYIQNNLTVEDSVQYFVYHSGSTKVYDLIKDTKLGGSYWEDDAVIKYSDYQKLRRMFGYKEVALEEGKFILHCISGVKTSLETDKGFQLTIGESELTMQDCFTEAMGLQGINGYFYAIVVPDEVAGDLEVNQSVYGVNTEEETTKENYEDLCKFVMPVKGENGVIYIPLGNVYVKGALLEENRTIFTIMIFTLFYLGLIFICVAATILAVQQLSDSMKYKFRYQILSHLGMERKRMEGLILKQFCYYFGFPMLMPLVISTCVTVSFNQLLGVYLNSSILIPSLMSSFGLFLFVYVLYFLASYMGYRKNVLHL